MVLSQYTVLKIISKSQDKRTNQTFSFQNLDTQNKLKKVEWHRVEQQKNQRRSEIMKPEEKAGFSKEIEASGSAEEAKSVARKILEAYDISSKRTAFHISTVLEFAKVINSGDLDIYTLESLAKNTMKGDLVVKEVRFLRQAIFNPDKIAEKPALADEGKRPFAFDLNDSFITYLRDNPQLIDIETPPESLPESLSADIVSALKAEGIRHLIPLLPREGHLIGLIMMGQKISHEPFSEQEVELLKGFCEILAISLYNSYLYKQQERKIEELQN